VTDLPKGWTEVALGDICEFRYGKSLPAAKRSGFGHPVFGSNGQVGAHSTTVTEAPAIVIGRKGSFGEVHWSDQQCWPIDTTYFVDAAATGADLRWLFHRLRRLGLTELNRAAAIPGLNREDAYRKKLLLPPLEEQRRIAAILDKADELRAKRRAAFEQLDSLTQAIFLGVQANHPGTPRVTIDSVAARERGSIRTGPFGSQLLHSEFVDEGVRVLGIDNVVANEFRWAEQRYITYGKYETLRRFTVHPGDVLVTIMGTCGRAAVVPDNVPVAINTKHLCCITVDRAVAEPRWLHAALLYDRMTRRQLGERAKGAVMPGLNMGLIKATEIPLPSLVAQQEFVAQSEAIDRLKMRSTASDLEVAALSSSLQARAFRGEL